MKSHVRGISLLLVSVALVLGLCGTAAYARDTDERSETTLRFLGVTSTNADIDDIGTNQFLVDVVPTGVAGQKQFIFQNVGPLASSITGIFFDDERLEEGEETNGVLSAFTGRTITGTGVSFIVPTTTPLFVGGATLTPAFVTTSGLVLTTNTGVTGGIEPGETLRVTATLQPGVTNAEVIQALENGTLRVGVQAQGFTTGGAGTFIATPTGVTVIPAPAAILLGSLGAGLVGLLRRRRML